MLILLLIIKGCEKKSQPLIINYYFPKQLWQSDVCIGYAEVTTK